MEKKNFLSLAIYLINLIAVILLIAFVIDNRFVKILLALYIMLFTTLFSFYSRKKR